MIPEEAKFLRKVLVRTHPKVVLNLGSSTIHFRTVEQPFISECFGGMDVVHIDQKKDAGIDICCDLEDDLLSKRVNNWLTCHRTPGHDPKEVLQPMYAVLSNVLEHVSCPSVVLQNVVAIEPTWLYVSVPHNWPYHPDPIDTMLRPTIKELSDMVGWYGYVLVESFMAECERGSISCVHFRREPKKTELK